MKKEMFIAGLLGPAVIATGGKGIEPKFTDVSAAVGLGGVPCNKYWTPVVADLDRDGYYDLVLCNHGAKIGKGAKNVSPEMYWGTATGFVPFRHRKDADLAIPVGGTDYHGFSAGYFGNKDDFPDLVLTVGGANGGRGNLPITAEFAGGRDGYIVRKDKDRKDPVVDASLLEIGIDGFGRGRSAFFIDMDQDGDLDMVYNNKGPDPEKSDAQNITDSKFMYEWKDGRFNRVPDIGALKECGKECAALADVNHDGLVDLLYFDGSEPMECWISQGKGFVFKLDNSCLPGEVARVSKVAEIDYDGDGDFDLYLARSGYKEGEDDLLLEWDQSTGKYVDVSRSAGIPKGGMHDGLSVGDFDNNGCQDVFIGVSNSEDKRLPDLILMNNGDKTFTIATDHGASVLVDGEQGDQGEVFDFDKDGRLDILSGSKYGPWRMFRNTTENPKGNHLIVQVGRSSSPEGFAPLGASVTVVARKGEKRLVVLRRIGSQGQSHAQSFIDTMHFGLGECDTVEQITVGYGTHSETTKFAGADAVVNKTVTVGRFCPARESGR